jgi:hypothetical protein
MNNSNKWSFWGRTLLYLVLLKWGIQFIFMDFETNEIGSSFWHNIDLGFHEAGHLVFQPFGRFIMVLGGTLGQLLTPFALMLLFIFKNKDYFGASLGLWWLGQSVMDCAPYINDALAQRLTLLGGGTGHDRPGSHDWNYILNQLSMIEYHHGIATAFDLFGVTLMIAAFIWGGILLYFQYKQGY